MTSGIVMASVAILLYGRASLAVRWPAWRILAFSLGVVIVTLGTVIPMPGLVAHMGAHGAVVAIGVPLIVLGRPVGLLLRVLPREGARRTVRILRSRPARILAFPPLAWLAFVVVQVAFHLPPLFESALVSEPLHLLEHLLFVTTALWFWTVMLAVDPLPYRWPVAVRSFMILGAMPLVDVGAIRLMTVGEPDAGVTMLAAMMPLAYFAAGIFWLSLFDEERRAEQRAKLLRSGHPGATAILLALLASLGLAGSGTFGLSPARAEPAVPPAGHVVPSEPGEGTARGQTLFRESCSSCHGFDGSGVPGKAPSLTHAGAAAADFYLRTGRMPMSQTGMQPLRSEPRFGDREIRDLVDYVAGLGNGPPIPDVDPARGDVSEGRQLFATNCASCHAMSGAGGVVIGAFAPSLWESTPTEVGEAIRIGPYVMPRFGRDQISDREVDSIARYVELTQKPDDRGGWGIGHIGPVPEGMVAWFGGLAAALLIARMLGQRKERDE